MADPRKIAEGREAEMFEWGDGRILRLYRRGSRSSLDFQVQALSAARAAGVRVPEVYESIEVDGRMGMVMERLDGVDLLTLIGRQPWRVWSIGRTTGRTHAALNLAPGPDALPTAHERLERILANSEKIPAYYRDPGLERLKRLPMGDRLLHGDFHPGNIMMHGGEAVVLDWSNAMRGDPEADFARTLLVLELGSPPPGTALFLRVLATFGRRLLIGAYRRSYRQSRPPNEARLRDWEVPIAVARLAEGIEEERPALMRFISRRL